MTTRVLLSHTSAAYADLARKLRRDYENGATIRELAREHQRSFGWVHRALEDAGTTFRPRGGRKKK